MCRVTADHRETLSHGFKHSGFSLQAFRKDLKDVIKFELS